MHINKSSFFKSLIIFLIILSFFFGYYLKENAAGGAGEFYLISWPIIQSFKNDFWLTIQNYTSFKYPDFQLPFSHIINAYLNPFSNNLDHFQLSTTVISFTIFCIFALVLKKAYLNVDIFDIFLTSSVILLLPFFRTSAFVGKNENYGWLFFILSLYLFFEIKNFLKEDPSNKNKIIIVLFCFVSACGLYARQALLFLPISYLLYLFISDVNRKIIFISIISYLIFAIPGFFVILSWTGIFENTNLLPAGLFSWLIKPIHILKNIPILLSFFGFYLLPILLIEFFNSSFKTFFKRYYKSFLLALVVFFILSQINLLNYLENYKIAGGAVLKVSYLIQKENYFLLLIFASIGFSLIVRIVSENPKNNLTILLPIFIVYGFPDDLYQEYVEPLILLIFFLALKTDLQKVYFKNISLSNFIFLSYFIVYLAGAIYFKHFMFISYDEWLIYLNKV